MNSILSSRTLLAASLAFAAGAAQAQGLFDDNVARKNIADLRQQVEAQNKAIDERLGRIEGSLTDRSIELTKLIEALRGDLAKLRGQIEVMSNQVEQLERRQRDLYVDLDTRLRKMEQAQAQLVEKVTAPEREAAKEKEAYEAALNQFKLGNYQLAVTGFQGFMSTFTASKLLPSAQYWIGNAYYALRDYKGAITAQQKVLASWPESDKAPDALLNIASSQAELGDVKGARATLQLIVTKYPSSQAAEPARQRLRR